MIIFEMGLISEQINIIKFWYKDIRVNGCS